VDIGQARIFTLRGGDIIMWASNGDIAAGNAAKTVVTAPPTRVLLDVTTADVQTDLGGLATGGGIGRLTLVQGIAPGSVDLIAPNGTVDAGDAGIRATGTLNIAAAAVLNADNISSTGAATGVPSAVSISAPTISAPPPPPPPSTTSPTPEDEEKKRQRTQQTGTEEAASIFTVEVVGYGGAGS
jgi:hypothetical protein